MTKIPFFSIVAAVAAVAVPSGAMAAGFVNGSFETGTSPGLSSELGTGSTAITGWAVSSGSVDYIDGLWFASNGTRSIDLAGSSLGALSQTFDTIAGQAYRVTFDLSKNPFGGSVPRQVLVSAGGSSQTYGFSASNTSTNMQWAAQTFLFNASGISTTLTFAALNDGPYGPALDNVAVTTVGSVAAVPEAATWGLMLLGFGAMGYAMRRRAQGDDKRQLRLRPGLSSREPPFFIRGRRLFWK